MSDAALSAPLTDHPPGPPGLPLIGNLHQFVGRSIEFLGDVRREHGRQAWFWIGGHDFWLLSDPADIETVLLTEHRRIKKDYIYEKISELLGQGLVTSEGELWRRQRKIVSRPFAAKQVDAYAGQIRGIVDRHLERASGERDVSADMNHLTEDIVLEVLFGLPAGSGGQVGPAIETWMRQFHAEDNSILRIMPNWVPTPGRRAAQAAVATIDAFLYALIEQKQAEEAPSDDVLSRLIAAAAEEGGMSDQQLRDEAVTLFVAGHETTALALTYALRQLALHPEWQDRVRAEVREALPDGPRTAADMRALPVTTAVLKETMRLHPPAWAIGREALEDIVIGGRLCPKGTQLVVCQYVMHRDPEWFPEPERFDPQRWLDGLEERLPRFVYLPFGGGPRVCIGNHFAMLEAVIALATLLRERKVEPVGEMALELIPSVTLRPAHEVNLRYVEAP